MDSKKEIIVLSGGGHKGLVKIQNVVGKDNYIKGSCNLDFRPNNATLYLVSDNIAKIKLNDTNTTFEVPFRAAEERCCVVRSSSVTMFGGGMQKSKALAKIDEYNKQSVQIASSRKAAEQKTDAVKKEEMTIDDVLSASEWTKYDGNNFYFAVKPQLDEMFVCYPEEKTLCDAVPNSKWVRVDTADGYYVVGVLFNDDTPSFICYGVPSESKTQPPKELQNACVWLPTENGERGYWLIYQSARNGEIVK